MTSSRRNSAKVIKTRVGNFVVAMVTDLWGHLTYYLRGAWHTVYAMLLSNYMLPEIHTMKKKDFLKPIIHSQISLISLLIMAVTFCLLPKTMVSFRNRINYYRKQNMNKFLPLSLDLN